MDVHGGKKSLPDETERQAGKNTSELNEKLTATAEKKQIQQQLWQNDKTLELMEEALKELNPEQQQCVTLFYLEKKSYQEISEQTGYTMLQVKSYIQNGKRNLKILIEKKIKEECKANIMADNLKDILSHLSTEVDQETLLLYLQGKLSEEKKHEVEKKLLENEFADDAMEGFTEIKDKQHIDYMVDMLNRDLKKRKRKNNAGKK